MVSPFRFSRLLTRVRNRHLLLTDVVLLPMAAVLAFVLRLDSQIIQGVLLPMTVYALAAPFIKVPIFAGLGLYNRFWQYAGIEELTILGWSATIGALAQGALFLGLQALFPGLFPGGVPRSIPLIDILVTFAIIAAPRIALRAGAINARRHKHGDPQGPLQHVLIAGAGEAGVLVLRELQANPQMGLVPVGFVDDDRGKHGVILQRVRVLGGRDAIPGLVREHHVDQVIIAMPSAAGHTIREIVDICESAGVRTRIVPAMHDLIGGKVRLQELRDVQIEDLLRRAPVHTDTAQVAALLRGKRVLVTGAGGSIGSELCRQILRCEPASLVLLGHGENSIFDIANELRHLTDGDSARPSDARRAGLLPRHARGAAADTPRATITSVIADVRFPDRLQDVFAQHRPQIVFHAAAHKHVPLMEDNVEDAVSNNVLGTLRLVEASVAAGVDHFVLISTDKAVNPTNVMGATKRVAELIVQRAAQQTGRAYVAVRFGNVLGSRGSVVPFFQKQIQAGGPVTVTHPEVRRYFMTIPEAVQLVLQAAALGRGGEVFVLDMGEPVRILDLARDLIRLSGLEPDEDIPILFTGLRPGEKLFEELYGQTEQYQRTQHEKIFVGSNGANGDAVDTSEPLDSALACLLTSGRPVEPQTLRAALQALVPEYQPDGIQGQPEPAGDLAPA